ncbi:MAG: valine--tRNA ligase [Nitrospinae bacterium]|nr:valine--tRNA ligase [Nitrospinota bacterium]
MSEQKILLNKTYEHGTVEDKWYSFWLENGYFHADENSTKPPFSIVIPPPNITGSLHMGHALNNTLQDILIRWKKMQGFSSLWQPGTDHAGIATQNVVERMLREKGIDRDHLGREKFVEKVWEWKKESGGMIVNQLKKLGAACDWERERFTMDEGLSAAVRRTFVRLHEEGLIYQGNYIINWCPRCHTALSDLEVIYQEKKGALYYVRYPLADGTGSLTVATTRPETMLGDAAVAVNPDDERFASCIGKNLILPLMKREIPVIGDSYVDVKFGAGALKVTPAHDPNDFEIGNRHGLPKLKVMADDGSMNENAGKYSGMERFACRKAVVEDLEKEGLLEKVEDYLHSVGGCYRCHTVVEPTISRQWFVKIKPLAEPAMEAVRSGKIRIIPKNWENTYFEWMENIRDWCISRQIWWGHRIPAWHCGDCREVNVAVETPEKCVKCGGASLTQETDVLDTWFSSALWPFSTLGWPENTQSLKKFYPTSVLVTGFDILFFWVARMIMFGLKLMGDVPFRDVYIHALVRDAEGQKMSKSKGNIIDPLIIMEKFGTDAFRFTLAIMAAQGRDIKLSEDRVEGYRNFANKIWNASRFVLMNMDGFNGRGGTFSLLPGDQRLDLTDRWILSRLNKTAAYVNEMLEEYKFNQASARIYQFVWREFCDWYIELAKGRIFSGGEEPRQTVLAVLAHTLETTLRLLHPFMPFITEEIRGQMLPESGSIMSAAYPQCDREWLDEAAEFEMGLIMEVLGAMRAVRGEMNVPPSAKPLAVLLCPDPARREVLSTKIDYIVQLAGLKAMELKPAGERPAGHASTVVGDIEIFLDIKEFLNLEEERTRLEKELKKTREDVEFFEKKLGNKSFVERAPEEVLAEHREKQENSQAKFERVSRNLAALKAM